MSQLTMYRHQKISCCGKLIEKKFVAKKNIYKKEYDGFLILITVTRQMAVVKAIKLNKLFKVHTAGDNSFFILFAFLISFT